jgi:hypothetical protein
MVDERGNSVMMMLRESVRKACVLNPKFKGLCLYLMGNNPYYRRLLAEIHKVCDMMRDVWPFLYSSSSSSSDTYVNMTKRLPETAEKIN